MSTIRPSPSQKPRNMENQTVSFQYVTSTMCQLVSGPPTARRTLVSLASMGKILPCIPGNGTTCLRDSFVGVESDRLLLLREFSCGSKLAEAVTYARNQQAALCAFLEHGDVEISNNTAENAIRPFAVGRKNWLFSDTVKGAESGAIVYTLVETAKANGLGPYAYLNQLMKDLPWYGLNPSKEDLDNTLPWSPRMQQLNALDDTNAETDDL